MVEQGPSTAVKIGAAITAGALVAGGGAVLAYESGIFDSGASSHTQTIPTPEQPTIIPGTSVIRTATPEATAIPTPKPGFIENAGAFTYRTESGEVLSVPQIDGLIAKLVKVRDTNEVQYFAKEGNPYGIEANKSGGEYKPNVDIFENNQRKELGGVVLVPQVVKRLMDNFMSQITEQGNKWVVVLPVDISSLSEDKKILLYFENGVAVPIKIARLSFDGVLPVSDIIPGDKTLTVSKSPYYGWVFLDNIRSVAPYGDGIYPGKEINYLGVSGDLIDMRDQAKISSFFGKKITNAGDKINVTLSSSNGSKDVTRDKILSVGNNIPVFLQSSDAR
jgi:hypothetical protein